MLFWCFHRRAPWFWMRSIHIILRQTWLVDTPGSRLLHLVTRGFTQVNICENAFVIAGYIHSIHHDLHTFFDKFYTFVEHWLDRRYFVKICWSEMIRTCQKPWLFVQHTRFWWRRNRCSVDWQVLFVSCLISVLTSWPDWIRVFLACCSVDFLWKNSRFSPLLCQVRWPNEKARGGLGSPIQKWDCPEMQLKYNPTSLS